MPHQITIARTVITRSRASDSSAGSHVLAAAALLVVICGCTSSANTWKTTAGNDTTEVDCISSQIDNPSPPVFTEVVPSERPITVRTVSESEVTHVDWSLDQALSYGLQHSTVLRDIGGTILRSPETVTTTLSTQLAETDPRFGMEAALSAFDAQLAASANFNNNDRLYNNAFFAGGTNAFVQDKHDYSMELSKRTATGSRLAVRGIHNFDDNNAPANLFGSSWDSWFEGEIRQPLLQGGGVEFNRIAGPGATPGVYNGVLIARVNTDINQADFTVALRDYVSNIENAYWDLYLAYRELDARKKAMERALAIWNEYEARAEGEIINKAEEALARNQYYQMKADVDEALSGRLLTGTTVRNGAVGGTLQTGSGVLAAERRLRLLIGLPAADGSLIRPSDEPTLASIQFDWDTGMQEAMTQRPELQRQNIRVKKRELELLAARNFLNPSLDAVGRYRFRGFGDELIADGNQKGGNSASSIGNLATGDHQEWTLGVELTVPIGYRRGHAAVQFAELNLARDRMIQKELQREVISNLNGAFADIDRAYQAVQNTLNQYIAARTYAEALATDKFIGGRNVESDRLLDAQQRLVQSEIQFFRARAEYGIALKNLHYEKGSLLDYKSLRISGTGNVHNVPAELPALESDPLSPEVPAVPEPDMVPGDVLPPETAPPAAGPVTDAVPAPGKNPGFASYGWLAEDSAGGRPRVTPGPSAAATEASVFTGFEPLDAPSGAAIQPAALSDIGEMTPIDDLEIGSFTPFGTPDVGAVTPISGSDVGSVSPIPDDAGTPDESGVGDVTPIGG